MSIFGNIMSKIFGHAAQAAPAGGASGGLTTPSSQGAAGPGPAQPSAAGAPGGMGAAPAQSGSATSGVQGAGGAQNVDVAAILDGLAGKSQERLDWKHSIVDMMKLLGLDSSLTARKELASELHYSGDTNDSAAMNVWLHKQVMQKLAQNGGKVPEDLKH